MREYIGMLKFNERGRWEIEGRELTSGDRFKVNMLGVWVDLTMEHSHGEYYVHPKGFIQLREGMIASLVV